MAKKKNKPVDNDGDDVKGVEYKNTCKGVFTIPGMSWEKDESKPVPAEIAETKKFKNATRVGALVEA